MIVQRETDREWEYFLHLEDDLVRLSSFIELEESNFGCFSVEIVKQILAAGSELDVTLKELCKVKSGGACRDIKAYQKTVCKSYSDFHELRAEIVGYGLSFKPWTNWKQAVSPDWWGAYNAVKHDRGAKFKEANLGNLLNIMAALYLVKCLVVIEERVIKNPILRASMMTIQPKPKLFSSQDWFMRGVMHESAY